MGRYSSTEALAEAQARRQQRFLRAVKANQRALAEAMRVEAERLSESSRSLGRRGRLKRDLVRMVPTATGWQLRFVGSASILAALRQAYDRTKGRFFVRGG